MPRALKAVQLFGVPTSNYLTTPFVNRSCFSDETTALCARFVTVFVTPRARNNNMRACGELPLRFVESSFTEAVRQHLARFWHFCISRSDHQIQGCTVGRLQLGKNHLFSLFAQLGTTPWSTNNKPPPRGASGAPPRATPPLANRLTNAYKLSAICRTPLRPQCSRSLIRLPWIIPSPVSPLPPTAIPDQSPDTPPKPPPPQRRPLAKSPTVEWGLGARRRASALAATPV